MLTGALTLSGSSLSEAKCYFVADGIACLGSNLQRSAFSEAPKRGAVNGLL